MYDGVVKEHIVCSNVEVIHSTPYVMLELRASIWSASITQGFSDGLLPSCSRRLAHNVSRRHDGGPGATPLSTCLHLYSLLGPAGVISFQPQPLDPELCCLWCFFQGLVQDHESQNPSEVWTPDLHCTAWLSNSPALLLPLILFINSIIPRYCYLCKVDGPQIVGAEHQVWPQGVCGYQTGRKALTSVCGHSSQSQAEWSLLWLWLPRWITDTFWITPDVPGAGH